MEQPRWSLAVHGGAGSMRPGYATPEEERGYLAGIEAARWNLRPGGRILPVVEDEQLLRAVPLALGSLWGFVPLDDVRGKAFVIYWSWDGGGRWVRWERLGSEVR